MSEKKSVSPVIIFISFIIFFTIGVSLRIALTKELNLPILMYHHINETGDNFVTISVSLFEDQMEYLIDQGYHPVSFDEVIDFVDKGEPLPDKPVCIVFDDGYESNYKYGFPIMQKLKLKYAICIIGSSVGKTTYKETGQQMIPHMTWDEMRVMIDSGLVSIQNHTYDMHMYAQLETGTVRENALKLNNESEKDYTAALKEDYKRNVRLIKENLGFDARVFAYPNGKYDDLSEKTIRSLGARVTLSTNTGLNIIREWDRETLFLMKRYNINQGTDIITLQFYLDGVIPK